MTEALYRNKVYRIVEVGPGDCVYLESPEPNGKPFKVSLSESTLIVEPCQWDVDQANATEQAARRIVADVPPEMYYDGQQCHLCMNYVRWCRDDACVVCGRV